MLVKHGANVNAVDLWKFTPLHEAAAKGKYEICKLLLKVGNSVVQWYSTYSVCRDGAGKNCYLLQSVQNDVYMFRSSLYGCR